MYGPATYKNVQSMTIASFSYNAIGDGAVQCYLWGPAPAATISVTYGAGQVDDTTGKTTYTDFTAKNCAVSASVGLGNTQIECETAGLSKQVKASEMRWVVTVGGDTAKDASTQMTTFRPPTITAVTAAAALPTQGGGDVVITGTDFGTAAAFLRPGLGNVDYSVDLVGAQGSILSPSACVSSAAGTVLTCKSAAGTGTNLQWRVMTGGQTSAVFQSTAKYDDLSILNIQCSNPRQSTTTCQY